MPKIPFLGAASVLVVALVAAIVPTAYAQSPDELRGRLDETRQRLEDIDRERDQTEQQAAEARGALEGLQQDLDAAAAALTQAEQRAERADEAAEAARLEAERAADELSASEQALQNNEDELAGLAREAFKFGAPRSSPIAVLGSLSSGEGPAELADAVNYLQRGLGDWSVVVEQSETLIAQVQALAGRAAEEEQQRDATLEEADVARDDTAEAHAQVSALISAASVEQRRQEDRLAQLSGERDTARRRMGDLEQDLQTAEGRRRGETERAAQARRQVGPSASSGSLVTVGGITVSAEIGSSLEALLAAARTDGIVLGGSGWRSPQAQAQLRRANGCPDVYDSPASSCRVPTARPGSSEHEKGLAIDFTWQGRTICYPRRSSACSGNAAFDWLQRNAGRFGLQNLPSEAWHWSTTGR